MIELLQLYDDKQYYEFTELYEKLWNECRDNDNKLDLKNELIKLKYEYVTSINNMLTKINK